MTPSTLLLVAASVFRSCLCQAYQSPAEGPVLTPLTDPVVHGEGPYWEPTDNVLYYVDITGNTLHRYDPETKLEKTISFSKPVSLVVPIKDQRHKFVVALGLDVVVLNWDWDSGFSSTSLVVSVDQDKPTNRFNDGKADSRGRIWAGTMGYEDPITGIDMNQGTFYRIDNDPLVPCRADIARSPVSISNGMAWREDNKVFYYIDTPTRRVDAYDFDLDKGKISNRRTVFEFGSTPGNPDGMTIDWDGNLWIACWGGSMVIQIDPTTGKLLRQIKLPAERVTSVVFGGQKLDTLYVTTMRAGLNMTQLEQQPLAGALFEITNLQVTGTASKPAVVNCKCNN